MKTTILISSTVLSNTVVHYYLLPYISILTIHVRRSVMFDVITSLAVEPTNLVKYRAFHNVLHITNIYNKKTKGPTLMELFTATGKLKKFLLTTRNVQCVHLG